MDGLSRRQFLAVAGAAALTACTRAKPSSLPIAVTPTAPIAQDITLQAAVTDIDLGGVRASAWTYDGQVPGPTIRATSGQRVRITVRNDLPEETSVHWHGLAVPNAMDGVPGVTTPAIARRTAFAYDFIVPHPGSHWFHPHTGLQLDTGLYAPFIIDDPDEPGAYDREWVVVLDDWTQGVGPEPEQIFADLGRGTMMHHAMASPEVTYPMYLINGRPPADAQTQRVRPGSRMRLRIINAAASTVFTVSLGGHRMTVTHSDGYPVVPVETDGLRVGMGERFDVLVDVADGVFPLRAQSAGGSAVAWVRSASGGRSSEVNRGRVIGGTDLRAASVPTPDPDIEHDLVLAGSMRGYEWTINGRTYDRTEPIVVTPGEFLRLRLSNMSMMSHPMHLHGHTFQSPGGAVKDTILVAPMRRVDVDLRADNPGTWMLHCHNAYHAEAGMMTRLEYAQ